MKEYEEISNRIIEAISQFDDSLTDKTQFRHYNMHAHGEVVAHFAKAIIDIEFSDSKMKMVDGIVKMVKELTEINQ